MENTHTLKAGTLSSGESLIMGIAGTAPAYSMAATMATLLGAVGLLAPASLLYCGLIMFGVAFGFMRLSRDDPDAGASYAWVGKAFHPMLGFFAGWAIMVSSAVFMVSGTIPAATATLTLVAPGLTDNTVAVTAVAALWLVVISAVVLKSIKLSSYFQVTLTLVELAIVVAIIGLAISKGIAAPSHDELPVACFWGRDLPQNCSFAAHELTWSLFLGRGFTPGLFAAGALAALFLFWGWDVTANLNEETRDASRTAGRAGIIAMIVVLLLFVTFAVVSLLLLSDDEAHKAGTDIVFVIADRLMPRPWSYLAVLAVILSTIGTLETSILQFTRTMFAMGRGGGLHPRFAMLHATNGTPWVATLTIALISLALLVLSSMLPSVNLIVKDSINVVGFQVAFYYGLSCAACAWMQRQNARRSPGTLVFGVIWPLVSALCLFGIAIYSIPTFDLVTNIVGLGGMAIGFMPLLWRRISILMSSRGA